MMLRPARASFGTLSDSRGRPHSGRFGSDAVRLARWAWYHLCSFELVFVLFFFSNQLKLLPGFPSLPADETVVLMALSMPIGLYVIFRQGIYLPGLPIVAAGLALFGWATLSWGWSPSRVLASRTLSYLFTFNLWCLIAGALVLAPSRERVLRFLAFMLFFSMVIAGYRLGVYTVYGTFKFAKAFGDVKRVYLSWGYAATNGAIIAFGLFLFSRMLSLRQIAAALLFGVSSAFLLVGSGRGPLLGVVIACLVALASGLPRIGRERIEVPRWQLLGLGAVVLGVGYIVWLAETGTTFATFGRFMKLLEEAENPDVVQGPNRFAYFAAAIRFWLESPIIGNGIASFSLLFSHAEISGTQPHNIILEMLTDLGLVGLALLLWTLWSGLRCVQLPRLRVDGLQLCVLMLLSSRLLAAMISVDISGQQAMFLFLGLLAMRPPPGFAAPSRRSAARAQSDRILERA